MFILSRWRKVNNSTYHQMNRDEVYFDWCHQLWRFPYYFTSAGPSPGLETRVTRQCLLWHTLESTLQNIVEELCENRQQGKIRHKPVTVQSQIRHLLPACPCLKSDSSTQLAQSCCVIFCTKQHMSVFELCQSSVRFYIIVLDMLTNTSEYCGYVDYNETEVVVSFDFALNECELFCLSAASD